MRLDPSLAICGRKPTVDPLEGPWQPKDYTDLVGCKDY